MQWPKKTAIPTSRSVGVLDTSTRVPTNLNTDRSSTHIGLSSALTGLGPMPGPGDSTRIGQCKVLVIRHVEEHAIPMST